MGERKFLMEGKVLTANYSHYTNWAESEGVEPRRARRTQRGGIILNGECLIFNGGQGFNSELF